MPSHPNTTYKDGGWQGWGRWLGTGNQPTKAKGQKFLPFDEALRAARHLRLVSSAKWRLWCKSGARPANMPARPDQAHVHDGWMGWAHFLHHANLDAAAAPAETPQPNRKRAAASTRKGTARNRAGKRRR